MKILFISPAFYPATYYGGPIFSLYNSARCLAKNGFQVFVSTTNANGKNKLDVIVNKLIQSEKNLYIKYYSGGSESGFSIRMFLSLWKDFKNKDIVCLVSIFSPSTPLVLFLNMFFIKPLILSPRGQLGEWCLQQGNSFKKLWLKIFIKPNANKIVWEATSLSEKEKINKIYPGAKIEVIPSIINVEEYQYVENKVERDKEFSIYRKLTGINLEDKKIIVSMGRLHKVKGFNILIEAFAILLKQKPDCILLIAGEDFGERKNLEKIIDKFELNNRVFLVGNLAGKDKIEFLRNADLFALASHHENFGIVYAEALASGIPVIASRNTPWGEIEEYNCGFWVDNKPESFADSISSVLSKDYKSMGLNGKRLITEKYSMNRVGEKYKDLINKLVETK